MALPSADLKFEGSDHRDEFMNLVNYLLVKIVF